MHRIRVQIVRWMPFVSKFERLRECRGTEVVCLRMVCVQSVQPRLRVWRLEHDLRCCNPDRELRRKLRRFLHQPAGHYSDHLLSAEPGLHVWQLERDLRLGDPDRELRRNLRRCLHQRTGHYPNHLLPAEPGLHLWRLERDLRLGDPD